MAKYDPFDKYDSEKAYTTEWMFKTSVKIGILAGFGFGYRQMKGPTGKLVNKFREAMLNRNAEKEVGKMTDDFYMDHGTKANPDNYDLGLKRLNKNGVIDGVLDDVLDDSSNAATSMKIESLKKYSNKIENQIFTIGAWEHNVDRYNLNSKVKNILLDDGATKGLSSFKTAKDASLNKLRYETLIDHISKSGTMSGDAQLKSILSAGQSIDSAKAIRVIKEYHELYMSESLEYNKAYNKEMKSLLHNFRNMAVSNKKMDMNTFAQKVFNGNLETQDDAHYLNQIIIAGNSKHVTKNFGGKLLNSSAETKDNINLLRQLNAGELDKKGQYLSGTSRVRDIEMFDAIAKFDYTGQFKKIGTVLQNLTEEKHGVSSTRFNYKTIEGQKFAEIIINHVNKQQYIIRVPISMDGRMPGAYKTSADKIDRTFEVGDNYGDVKKNRLMNKSQIILHKVKQAFDSDQEKLIKEDPGKFVKRLTSQIQFEQSTLPSATGQFRDVWNYLGYENVSLRELNNNKSVSTTLKRNMKKTVVAMSNVGRQNNLIKNGKSVAYITFDFEFLAAGINAKSQPSPGAAASDLLTQYYKFGYSITDVSRGVNKIMDAGQLTSDHVVKAFDMFEKADYGAYTPGVISWLRGLVPKGNKQDGNGNFELSDDEIVEAFKKTTTDEAMFSKGKSRNNHEFIRKVAGELSAKVNALKNKGYHVQFVTKNGTQVDMMPFKQHVPELYDLINKEHIDIQSILYKYKYGKFGDERQGLNHIIMRLMNKIKKNSAVDIDDPNSPGNVKIALDVLTSKKSGLKFSPMIMGKIKDISGGLAHADPQVDALFTSIVLESLRNNEIAKDTGIRRFINSVGTKNKDINELKLLFSKINNVTLDDGRVATSSGMTHGAIGNLLSSFLHKSHMFAFADNALTKQWNQLYMGGTVEASKTFRNKVNSEGGTTKSVSWIRRTKDPLVTNMLGSAESFFRGAEDNKNYFMHQVMGDSVMLWNSTYGKEGFVALSERLMNDIRLTNHQFVAATDNISAQALNSVRKLERADMKEASKLAEGDSKVTQELFQQAAADLAQSDKYKIIIPSNKGLQASKSEYGGKFIKGEVDGRVIGLHMVSNNINPNNSVTKLMLEVEYAAEGYNETKSINLTARSLEFKAQASFISQTLADKLAFGDVDIIANADFIDKGYVGVMKETMFKKILNTHRNVLLDPASTKEAIDHAKGEIEKISKKLNAKWVGNQMIMDKTGSTSPAVKKFKKLGEGSQKMAKLYFGDVNLKFDELMGFMANAGHKWDQKMIDIRHNILNDDKGQIEKAIERAKKNIDKAAAQGINGLNMLTSKELTNLKMEAVSMIRHTFDAKVGEGLFLEPVAQGKGNSAIHHLGYRTVSNLALYNYNNGLGANRNSISISRQEAINIFTEESHLTESTKQYFLKNSRYMRDKKHYSVVKKIQNFKNALYGKANITNRLNLDDINKLIDRKESLEIFKANRRLGDNLDPKLIVEELKTLLDFEELGLDDDGTNYREMLDTILGKDMLEDMTREDADKVRDNIFSVRDQAVWLDEAKKRDTFNIGSTLVKGGPNIADDDGMFRFSIEDMLNRYNMENQGLKAPSAVELQKAFNAIVINAGEDGPIDLKSVVKVDGNVTEFKMKELVMAADTRGEVLSNRLNRHVNMATSETRQKFKVMQAAEAVHRMELSGGDSTVIDYKGLLKKQYFLYMVGHTNMDKASLGYIANNIEVPALMTSHKGIDAIAINAELALKQNKIRPDSITSKYAGIYENIINSKMNVVHITANAAENLPSPDITVAGNYFDYIRATFDKEEARKHIDDVRAGKANIYGHMVRHPVSQNGVDGVYQTEFKVVPQEAAEHIGMDDNSGYAHIILSGRQNADNDGDKFYLGAKNVNSIDQVNQYRKESKESLRRIMADPEMRSKIGITKTSEGLYNMTEHFSPIGFTSDGYASMSTYDDVGRRKVIQIDASRLDFSGAIDKISGMAVDLHMNNPENLTEALLSKQTNQTAQVFLSKNLIGQSTNLFKKRLNQVAQSGLIKDPLVLRRIEGNLSHGLAGIAQDIIGLSKHTKDTAQLADALSVLENITRAKPEQINSFKELWVSKFDNYVTNDSAEELDRVHRQAAYEFDLVMKAGKQAELLQEFGNPDVKNALRAPDNLLTGRSGTNIFDSMYMDANAQLGDMLTNTANRINATIDGDILGRVKSSSIFDDIGSDLTSRLRNAADNSSFLKKKGKYAAVAAGAYLALNLFRPNQLSNSMNPLDGFVDLGGSPNTDMSRIDLGLELKRGVPLDMVDASFSKQAFIKMNDRNQPQYRKSISEAINSMFESSKTISPQYNHKFNTNAGSTYSDYTSTVGAFGSSSLNRKY